MKYRELGKSGIEASVVGLGTFAIGGFFWGGSDENEAIKAIHAAIDAGMNLIDTAPVYGFGRSEEIVGKAIRDRRDKVVLATKCGMIWHEENGELVFASDNVDPAFGGYNVYKSLTPKAIRYEVEQSLSRLGVDCIDLYQAHWPDVTTPIADSMETLIKLKEEGKIRAIGCSNVTPDQMDEYRTVGQLDADQDVFSMLIRKHEQDNLPYCEKHGISYLSYGSLGQGLLTGKMGPDRTFLKGDFRIGKPRYSVENRQKVADMLEVFQPIAEQHEVSLGQIAIAWTFSQPGCSHALVGARNVKQAIENAGSGDVTLTAAELQTMTDAVEKHAAEIV